ncbi:MAG: hypothetical protein GPOALKHO_000654 [Sodalis sp.]|uniref:hypothetical protein n=1 Tax=Sodalis sp. (in: enterobacteria) TaxID=1898979 RepID=UPI0038738141|nr:MAG: hypothetical protein GPOALKHO_000654 [Sodalis sp.]
MRQTMPARVRPTTSADEVRASQAVVVDGAWLHAWYPTTVGSDPYRYDRFDTGPNYVLAAFPVFVRAIKPDLTLWGMARYTEGRQRIDLGDTGAPRTALDLDQSDRRITLLDTQGTRRSVGTWLDRISFRISF